MTVRELIVALSKYPDWIEVEMSMKVKVTTSISSKSVSADLFPRGKVYGVSGITRGKNEVVISGS